MLRKAYISFCTQAIKVLSFRKFREYFLDLYISMATDEVSAVKVHFLNSAMIIRPYIEQDLDLMIKFNNHLTTLRLSEKRDVSATAERVDHYLLKNKQSTPIINDAEEKAKLQFE